MKIYIATFSAILWAVSSAPAQLPNGELESITAELLKSFRAAYQPIDSIEFKVHVVGEENDAWRIANKNSATGCDSDVIFAAKGVKYFYREVTVDKLDGNVRGCDRAFDGKQYQDLHHRTNSLMITSLDPERRHIELGLFTPLAAYGFLSPFVSGSGHNISWQDLKETTAFLKMLQTKPVLEARQVDGHDVVTARFKTVVPKLWQQPVIVNVTFDKSLGYYPVSYGYTTETGAPLLEYQVLKAGRTVPGGFVYPQESLCKFYAWKGTGEFHGSIRLVTESFSVNTVTDDLIFTVDPMVAKQVYDKDNNVVLKVPK